MNDEQQTLWKRWEVSHTDFWCGYQRARFAYSLWGLLCGLGCGFTLGILIGLRIGGVIE